MRIAANLGVLDEVELIGRCMDHLRRIGVDLIVVTDVGSVDGTLDILSAYSRDDDVVLVRLDGDHDLWGFPERMYHRTVEEFDVDRVLFLDADEFWLPRSGRLDATMSLIDCECLRVERFNVPAVEHKPVLPSDLSPAGYPEIFLYTSPVSSERMMVDGDQDIPWIRTRVLPKVLVDPRHVDGVAIGAHGPLAGTGRDPRVEVPPDLVIAHVPFSSYDRFHRKLVNIDRSMALVGHQFKGFEAWHWRRWIALARQGQAEQEFDRQVLSPMAFEAAVSEGLIQSAATYLAHMSTASAPTVPPQANANWAARL